MYAVSLDSAAHASMRPTMNMAGSSPSWKKLSWKSACAARARRSAPGVRG